MDTTEGNIIAHSSNAYLFKNGYGMITKTFEFPPNKNNNDTPVEIFDPPSNPVHGTFWIQPLSDNTSINSIRTQRSSKFVDKECLNIQDLIVANINENVELLITDSISRSKEWISGKIISVKRGQELSEDDDTNISDNQSITSRIGSASISHQMASCLPAIQSGDLVLFETNDNGLLALSLSNIQSIRSTKLKTTYQHKVFKNCLSINYINKSDSIDMGLMKYLALGITWAPSYNLIILNSNDNSTKKLRLLSKAVILNDIENMNVNNLYCIVGFPNISKFASVIDPIISGENVTQFLERLKQCENENRNRNYNNSASITSNSVMKQQIVRSMITSGNSYGPDQNQHDTDTDDLHLYEFKNVLLQKKERLMLPIFDVEIPYKDVYHCKIDLLQNEHSYFGHINSGHDENKQFEEVWHSVEFENQSNFVWTTAPIVITKGQEEQQFIGQDTLTYTLKGSAAFVNLTKALDVRVQLDEKVTNANQSTVTISRVRYQTDHIDGKISIMNYKSEDIVIVINLASLGKFNSFSITPKKDIIKTNGYTAANKRHNIQWEINVKAKQTVEIKYVRLFNKII